MEETRERILANGTCLETCQREKVPKRKLLERDLEESIENRRSGKRDWEKETGRMKNGR